MREVTAKSLHSKSTATSQTIYERTQVEKCIAEVECEDVVYAVGIDGRVKLPNHVSVPDPHKLRNVKVY